MQILSSRSGTAGVGPGQPPSPESMAALGALVNFTRGGEQYQHAVWTGGARYASTRGAGLYLGTLDAGLVCPVLNAAADPALGPEAALRQACFDYHVPDPRDPGDPADHASGSGPAADKG